ncbi:MAG: AarF/UbiB family protein [Bdellovibrionota bacterium]
MQEVPSPAQKQSNHSESFDYLAEALREAGSGRSQSGLRAWLATLDMVLRAVEQTAWELRGLADQAVGLWDSLSKDWKAFAQDFRDVRDQAAGWPAKISRLSSTGWMLFKVSGSYRLWGTRLAFLPRKKLPAALEALHETNARRFYDTSVQQGGAFLKVGQMLSARPDLLPKPWIDHLSKLQDQAPEFPFEEVKKVIEEDLGMPLTKAFSKFEKKPIAAASIGQVHKAKTKDGQWVAVKVQRPGIGDLIDLDMSLLEVFLESLKSLLPPTDYETISREVRARVRAELDYEAEAKLLAKMEEFFQSDPGVIVPRPLFDLCGPRVITTVFVEGRKITDVLDEFKGKNPEKGEEGLSKVLGKLLQVYVRQVLELGHFQADPHPGNFLVTKDGKLVLLDFGCARDVSEETLQSYLLLVQHFISGNKDGVIEELWALGFKTASGKPDTLLAFADIFLKEFRKAAASNGGGGFSWPTKEELLSQAAELLGAATADPVIRLPEEFIMLARVFGTMGGLFMHYRPQVDYQQAIFPTLVKAMGKKKAA